MIKSPKKNAKYTDLNPYNPKKQSLLYDMDSIYQSIDNMVNTLKGERLFRPNYGIDLEEYLFDLIDRDTVMLLLKEISQQVEENDPRINVDLPNSEIDIDPDNHRIDVYFTFALKDSAEVFQYQTSIIY